MTAKKRISEAPIRNAIATYKETIRSLLESFRFSGSSVSAGLLREAETVLYAINNWTYELAISEIPHNSRKTVGQIKQESTEAYGLIAYLVRDFDNESEYEISSHSHYSDFHRGERKIRLIEKLSNLYSLLNLLEKKIVSDIEQ